MRLHSTAYWIRSSCFCQGSLVVSKYVKSGHYVLMCDDCETIWNHPKIGKDARWAKDREPGEIKNATLEEKSKLWVGISISKEIIWIMNVFKELQE